MPSHNRHIAWDNKAVRVNINFERRDLLLKCDASVINPHTGKALPVPVQTGKTRLGVPIYMGPNLLDCIVRAEREILLLPEEAGEEEEAPTEPQPVTQLYWFIRPVEDFFCPPRQRKKLGSAEHPFLKRWATGGEWVSERGSFIQVMKRSSVSVSEMAFRLLCGTTGNTLHAAQRVRRLAVDAWERDLERALELYRLLVAQDGEMPDDEVPARLRVSAAVSQEVERQILREACQGLGVDPDMPLPRQTGRPRKPRSQDDGESGNTIMGEVLTMTLLDDESVIGTLHVSFNGLVAGTALASLTIPRLAQLLVALEEAGYAQDVDYLEAYLEAANPDWREEVAGQAVEQAPASPHEILGIDREASTEEARAAYRELQKHLHPDRQKAMGTQFPDIFAKWVTQAYTEFTASKEG